MSLAHTRAARLAGPLFVSRSILVVSSSILWVLSLVTAALSLDGGSKQYLTFGALAFDLVGFLAAVLASAPKTPRPQLPWLRLLWLASSIASGMMTSQAVTVSSGYFALAFNVVLGTSLVFLVAMRWDLLGFLLLIAANSVLSGAYYATTPRFGSGDGLLIFFITLFPGLLGALTVFILRSIVEGHMARQTLHALQTLMEHADARASERSGGLAETHLHIQELFAKVAEARGGPLDPELSEQAQALGGQLRAQLMMSQSTNWLTESLALAGLEGKVAVVAQPDLLERLPQASRSAVLAVTMLLAATPVNAPENAATRTPGATVSPGKLHLYVEPHVDEMLLMTWRVTELNPHRCTPALWSELESLGVPRVRTDPEGASIMVHVKAPKAW
ncbi:hypothetical protein ACLRGI_18355 [Paenarthrobacter nitroguajacolicus]|uniref:hypothetical protein n=1 Tax=Paenarthrobacter nitroguajacolicus TaxID=211146 RepID=UPI003ADA13E7